MKHTFGAIVLVICLVFCMGPLLVSCSQPEVQGQLEILFSDAESRSILPSNTKITWITVEGSLNGSSEVKLATQSFALGSRIDIQGLAAGTWTIGVTGYNGKPGEGGKAITSPAVDPGVSIRSGHTTQALFVLHYVREGIGSAQVNITWPNYSVSDVSLVAKTSEGVTVGSSSVAVSTTEGSAQLDLAGLSVGNYDLDVSLANASGSVIAFPMLDMVSIFNGLQSTGTITLVASDVLRAGKPGFSVTSDGPSVSSRSVTLSSSTPNARLFYTTDGNPPSFSNGQPDAHTYSYTQPIVLTKPVTVVKAVAAKDGYQDSEIADSGELTVSGSDDQGGVDITNPSQISNVVVALMSEEYLENPLFQITYDMQSTPVLDTVVWYLDGSKVAEGTADTYTYEGFLSSGRHQVTAKVFYYDGSTKRSSMGTLRFNNNGRVSKPVVLASEVDSVMRVSIATATTSAMIFYTADDSEPTLESTLYEGPFAIDVGSTVKALAVAEEYRDSEVVCTLVDNEGSLTVRMPSSVTNIMVSADGETVSAQQPRFSVTYDRENVSDETIGWYLDEKLQASLDTDGDADPTTFRYGGTLTAGRHQMRVKITYADGTATLFATGSFRFDILQVEAPTLSMVQVEGGKQVTLACATEASAIYYTITGNDPNTARPEELYTGPFTVPVGTTVKALAVKAGLANSEVVRTDVGYELGDTGPAGGIVFFIDAEDEHAWTYLEAAASDDGEYAWGGYEVFLGGTDTDIGTGNTSTGTIVTSLQEGTYAAKVSADKSVSYGGTTYDDWFLPSRDELDALYDCWAATGRGSFAASGYWSSSEDTEYISWMQDFTNGLKNYGNGNGSKILLNRVRSVRAF